MRNLPSGLPFPAGIELILVVFCRQALSQLCDLALHLFQVTLGHFSIETFSARVLHYRQVILPSFFQFSEFLIYVHNASAYIS